MLMVSKVTVKNAAYTNILMGSVQAAIAHGVLDAGWPGDIPRDKVNDLGIIYSVWLDPSVTKVDRVDHKALFAVHREATRNSRRRGCRSPLDRQTMQQAVKERDANNFPIFGEYGIKSLGWVAPRRSTAWTPMHRESNG